MDLMLFEINRESKIKAKQPHELFMVNLAVFHLLLAPISFMVIGDITSLLVPLIFSCAVIVYIYLRSKKAERSGSWYEMVHGKLAFRRGTLLLMAYAATAVIIAGGWLLGMSSDEVAMQNILLTISTRIGLMPTFIMVVITFVMEANAVHQAGIGEVPESFLNKYPAPANIPVIDIPS
jgi:hypothetical protein